MLENCFTYTTNWDFKCNPINCSIVIFGMKKGLSSIFVFHLGNALLTIVNVQGDLEMVVSNNPASSILEEKAI